MLRNLVSLILLALLGAGLAQESEVRWNASDWESMDPAYITLQQESAIAMNLYNGLVNWDYGSTEIVPDLAESWDISEDGTAYTFHLRPGVMWHKGYGELNADDVKYSFDRIRDPATSAPLANTYSIIDSVDVIDDSTVQFTLNEPYAPFLLLLVPYKAGGIVNQQAVEEFGADYGLNPVGTGPFEWVEGDPRGEIVLQAFDDYYAGRADLDRLVFVHIPEDAVAYAAFEGGDLDMVNVSDPDVLARYESDPDIEVATNSGTNLNYIPLQVSQPPFDDIRVRQAVQHAIDKQAILDTVLAGIGVDLTGPVPAGTNCYEPDVTTYEYDPERARALLAEAGYPDGLDTTLFTYIGGPAVSVSTIVQDYLEQVGIRAELRALEISAWSDVINQSAVPASYMRITRSSDPHEFLQVVALSESVPQWNFGRFDNPEVDALIREGASETDPDARCAIYSDIQRLIVDDAAFVWIFSDVVATAYRPSIEGFELDPLWNQRAYPIHVEPN